MFDVLPHVLAVNASLSARSHTGTVIHHVAELLRAAGCQVDVLDMAESPLPLLNTDSTYTESYYEPLKQRVVRADVILLGTPDYHGCMSGAAKNFLDHFWKEFAGKLFASVVSSFEKGLTVTDQIRTAARQCYAWSLPYGVSFAEKSDVHEGAIVSDALRERLAMLARDLRVYGGLLAAQRAADLASDDPGFMARYRG